ncbi:response regulator transcription factor [Paraburkholderia phosphatilytica]|uniref:response regulator transcription factor n=1 Tax=Paraburkholderia phosphatilytica TaxID=2282883 RepID=UPI000E50BA87|nr:response regulator transcription factor [Paraburkholderia phosphatilytica]
MKFAVMTTNSSLFNLICLCFSDETIECLRFNDDVALSRAIYREEYHAIIVDAATGIDANRAVFARRACYGDRRAPLIVVGAFDGRDGIEQAFNAGADDVVRSPVDRNELAVRTHLALRRFQSVSPPRTDDCLCYGPYRLDRRAGVVLLDEHEIRLTVREFAIAWLLFSHAGEYVSRRTIAGAIWSSTEDIVGRTLEQHIYKLRKKLNLNGTTGVQLRTMYAHGYRIELCDGRQEPADAREQQPLHEQPLLAASPRPVPLHRGTDRVAAALDAKSRVPVSRQAASDSLALASCATRVVGVHAEDSEAACTALPWAQYATFWRDGTTRDTPGATPRAAVRPAGITATYVAPDESADSSDAGTTPSFAVPAALLVHSRQRG